ncbi:Facilitated trehalose transporter Tret1 [Seminavis robusta]|uniref:Hexose transporter 1 n=1 Tax=Seminavis robusta TaxID=568900 RepID=A0A9N8DED5_9STRA|nr:Facilitated trehalose transporter Tret1 [Seminavis robusta]|eukprot:Sro109_g054670.1 Facilitated trehalose transporter Tret1 (560) ;mRNA; f:95224-97423
MPSDEASVQSEKTHEGEHHGDYSSDIPISSSVYLYTFCASVNSCNLGYDIGVSTNLGPLIQADFDLTDLERELLIGSLNFMAMWGALMSQYFSDRFGRRMTFIVASFGFLNGLIIMAIGQTYGQILAGRILVGIGCGVGFAVDPLYISEIAPAKHRGELVTWSDIGINVGVVLGFSTGLLFDGMPDGDAWRAMCMLGLIFPVTIMFLTVGILPETPRWFVLNGLDNDARLVLQDIYPADFNVDLVIDDIKEALERERLAEQSVGWSVFWRPSPAISRMLLLGLLVPVAQQTAGIDAIQYYLLDVMDESGVMTKTSQKIFLIVLGLVKLVCIMISSQLLDRMGRRFTFFLSLTGLIISLVTVSISFGIKSQAGAYIELGALSLYLASYGLGLGPAGWLLPSEIFATCIRAKGVSVATFLNRLAATITVSSFLSIKNTITWPVFFLILAGFCLFTLIMLYLYLPETKGRSLEDMTLYFAEETGDFSILDAERKLRVETELEKMEKSGKSKKDGRRLMKDETTRTAAMTSTRTFAETEASRTEMDPSSRSFGARQLDPTSDN